MRENITFYSYSIKDTENIAKVISKKIISNSCLYISGEMGTGKTNLSKFIASNFNINDLGSATYSKVFLSKGSLNVIHCDFYHINPNPTFIETEIIPNLINPWLFILEWPKDIYEIDCNQLIHIKIKHINKFSRKISFSCFMQ